MKKVLAVTIAGAVAAAAGAGVWIWTSSREKRSAESFKFEVQVRRLELSTQGSVSPSEFVADLGISVLGYLKVTNAHGFARQRIQDYIARAEEANAQVGAWVKEIGSADVTLHNTNAHSFGHQLGWISEQLQDLRGYLNELDALAAKVEDGSATPEDLEWFSYFNYGHAANTFMGVVGQLAQAEMARLMVRQGRELKDPLEASYTAEYEAVEEDWQAKRRPYEDLVQADCELRARYVPLEQAIDEEARSAHQGILQSLAADLLPLQAEVLRVREFVEQTKGADWDAGRTPIVQILGEQSAVPTLQAFGPEGYDWWLRIISYRRCQPNRYTDNDYLTDDPYLKEFEEKAQLGTDREKTEARLVRATLTDPTGKVLGSQSLEGLQDRVEFKLPAGVDLSSTCGWRLDVDSKDSLGGLVTFLLPPQDEARPNPSASKAWTDSRSFLGGDLLEQAAKSGGDDTKALKALADEIKAAEGVDWGTEIISTAADGVIALIPGGGLAAKTVKDAMSVALAEGLKGQGLETAAGKLGAGLLGALGKEVLGDVAAILTKPAEKVTSAELKDLASAYGEAMKKGDLAIVTRPRHPIREKLFGPAFKGNPTFIAIVQRTDCGQYSVTATLQVPDVNGKRPMITIDWSLKAGAKPHYPPSIDRDDPPKITVQWEDEED